VTLARPVNGAKVVPAMTILALPIAIFADTPSFEFHWTITAGAGLERCPTHADFAEVFPDQAATSGRDSWVWKVRCFGRVFNL
jgi:hypothetical protein